MPIGVMALVHTFPHAQHLVLQSGRRQMELLHSKASDWPLNILLTMQALGKSLQQHLTPDHKSTV